MAETAARMKLLSVVTIDFSATPARRATPYAPRPDDVIIVGYLKCGTTWVQQIMHQIRTAGDESFSDIYDVTFFLPDYYHKFDIDLNKDQPMGGGRIFKSHARYENIPKMEGKTRFVVIVRDPYDAELSMVKFLWRYFGADRDMTAEEYDTFVEGLKMRGDYAGFIENWWPHRDDPNVLWVHYEDLQHDLAACVDKIAEFYVGKKLDQTTKDGIVPMCTFEYMSKNGQKFTAEKQLQMMVKSAMLHEGDQVKSLCGLVRPDGGQIGQGRMLLYEATKRRIDQRWSETMDKRFGLKNYQEMLKESSWFRQ